MSLLDHAKSLNAEDEARRNATSEHNHRLALRQRRVTIYSEYGRRWFDELGQAMSELASEFNKSARDDKKHIEVIRSLFDLDRIRIRFKNQDKNELEPCSALYRTESELRVSCAFRSKGKIFEEHFHVLPTEAFEIRVKVSKKSEVRRVMWPEDEGRKTTGNIWDDLRLSTEKVKSIDYLDVKQFADHVLELFVRFRW